MELPRAWSWSCSDVTTMRALWVESYEGCRPLALLCGDVALFQLRNGRGFVNESPAGSKLYHEPPWRQVAEYPGVVCAMADQCMAGLKSSRGLPQKKRTELWAAHEALSAVPGHVPA